MLAEELFGRLGPLPSVGTSERQTPFPESSSEGKDKGTQTAEDAPPSGTPLSRESDIRRLEAAAALSAPSFSRTLAGETSKRDPPTLTALPWRGRRVRFLPMILWRISSFLRPGVLMARVPTLPQGPFHGFSISVLCWTRSGRRLTSSGCLRNRFKPAIGRGCDCSRG